MPKRGAAALLITTVALVLLLNFKTPDQRGTGGTAGTGALSPAASAPATGSSGLGLSENLPAATTAPAQGTANGSAKIDGSVVATRYGDVQVEIQLSGGKLSDVIALALPTGRHSSSISSAAAPLLRSEALQAQSATIDIVSGATYTSMAYAQSLQAALDQAGQ